MAASNSQTQNTLAGAGCEVEPTAHDSRETNWSPTASTVFINSHLTSPARGRQLHAQHGLQPRMYQWYSEPGPYDHLSLLRRPTSGIIVNADNPGQGLLAGRQYPETVSQQHNHDAGLDAAGTVGSSVLNPRTFSGGRNALPLEAGPRDPSFQAELLRPTTTTTTNSTNPPLINRGRKPAGGDDATESAEKRFACDVAWCEKSFATTNDLSRHKASVHNLITQATNTFYCQGRSCLQNSNRCVRQWTRKDNFVVHLRTQHSDENLEDLLERSRCSQPHRHVLGDHAFSPEAPHRPILTPVQAPAQAPGPWPFGQSQQIGHTLDEVAGTAASQPFSPTLLMPQLQGGGQAGGADSGVGGVDSATAMHGGVATEQSQVGGALMVSSRDIIVMDGLIVHLDNTGQDVSISCQLADTIFLFRDRLMAERSQRLGAALTHGPPSGQPDPVQMYTYL